MVQIVVISLALVSCIYGAPSPSKGYPYFTNPLAFGIDASPGVRTPLTQHQYSFKYAIPGHARQEVGKVDGSVEGYYTYVDPNGDTARVEYVADKDSGFQVRANNLPQHRVELPEVPQDTPEVAAARRHHLQLYAEAKERILAVQRQAAVQAQQPVVEQPVNTPTTVPNVQASPLSSGQQGPVFFYVYKPGEDVRHPPTAPLSVLPHTEGVPQGNPQRVSSYYYSQGAPAFLSHIPVSLTAASYKVVPVAAVHDAQTSPSQQTGNHRDQTAPIIYTGGY